MYSNQGSNSGSGMVLLVGVLCGFVGEYGCFIVILFVITYKQAVYYCSRYCLYRAVNATLVEAGNSWSIY